jgi:protein-L-isoaspartate(D-aspartate) O-methyltransferase
MSDDTTDFGARRARMVDDQLAARGLRSDDVLAAMRSVPRHLFVPPELAAEAYVDSPLPIGLGQTISQPYMVALMTELLRVDVRSRVLEIGAGSGYQTAVLAEVAGEVYALELLAPLAERARLVLARLGYQNTHTAIADGSGGWPEMAPFDAVLVAAAAPQAPPALLRQLSDGGRLVMPLGHPHGDQVLTLFERVGDEFHERRDTRCRFVPLVSDEPADERRRGGALPEGEAVPGTRATAAPVRRAEEEEVASMKAVAVRVSGMVQGVYYRASARHEGERLGLRGWVGNASDGSVALHLQGDAAVVDAMLAWCRVGPPAARVSRVEVSDAESDESLSGFEVR